MANCFLVAGVSAGQRAQRHHPRHESHFGVRFTGPDKLVQLIEVGEVAVCRRRGYERLDRAG